MNDVAVLVNPAAGGGRASKIWERLQRQVTALGEARCIVADSEANAVRELDQQLRDEKLRTVIAVGGDGTVHLVVQRLLASGRGTDVPFAFVPAGTGADLARGLGIPKRPAEALQAAMTQCASPTRPPRPMDLIEVAFGDGERRFCVNVASTGLSGALVNEVNARQHRGPWVYLFLTLKGLLRYEPAAVRVVVDGREIYEGGIFLAAVANSSFFGRGMKVAPEARVDDGEADIVVIPPVPLAHVPWRLLQFYTGRHVRLPFISVTRGREVRVEPQTPEAPLRFEIDGEAAPVTSRLAAPEAQAITLRVLPAAVRVLA